MQDPVRVLVVQRGVQIDHLRFDPDSELDGGVGAVICTRVDNIDLNDLVNVGLQSIGKLCWVGLHVSAYVTPKSGSTTHCPVAKSKAVIIARVLDAEPT